MRSDTATAENALPDTLSTLPFSSILVIHRSFGTTLAKASNMRMGLA